MSNQRASVGSVENFRPRKVSISFQDEIPLEKTSSSTNEKSSTKNYARRQSTVKIDENTGTVWKAGRRFSRQSVDGVETIVSELTVTEVNVGTNKNVSRKSISYLKKELEIDYHQIALESLYHRFGTNPDKGLDDQQRAANLAKYGKNELTPPEKEALIITFLKTLIGGFQLLLWAGSLLSFVAYIVQYVQLDNAPKDNLYMGVVLGILVLLLGLFTFYQEYSSNKVMESFAKMVPSFALALRNGQLETVNSKDLVVGDIIEVKFGDQLPADIRIVHSQGLKVDNSSLTGESEPQSRSNVCTDENPMETKNLAFFSSNALEGTAKGVVVCVGDNTFIGRIAGLASGLDASETPLSKEVTHFVTVISVVVVINGLVFFAVSLSMGYTWIDAVIFLIGIIVANVPEGLLVTFTVILALTAKRMTNKNCLVKHLHAVETMGSCSVICSDKTGTLTQNIMTVAHYWSGGEIVNATQVETGVKQSLGFKALTTVARLCSRAKFMETKDVPLKQRKIAGDASETAILRAMEGQYENVHEYQEKFPKAFEVPFNSTNKYQYSIHDTRNDVVDPNSSFMLVLKGAPERVIKFCKRIIIDDVEVDLDQHLKQKFVSVYEELGSRGERVIGFADARLPNNLFPPGFEFNSENTEGILDLGLRFTGIVSMIDPPRPGVADAVQTCRTAGIRVVMVTGDHPITAKAIAQSVGIISDGSETLEDMSKRTGRELWELRLDENVRPSAAVCSGEELSDLSSHELDEYLMNHKEIVFARVSPQQKLIIVEGFQRLGYVVAVTGDGVNDSPALKRANIGIAMGISGSDVSKQAADLILLDDNFATIVSGVEEGRLIFDNLKKCIRYLLCANTAFLTPFLAFITLEIPLPMGTIPMLMICLGTDIMPTISLSYEPAEGDIMRKPPRNADKDNLVTKELISYAYGQLGIIEAFAGFFGYCVTMGQNGFHPWYLIHMSDKWYDAAINDLMDSYGQEWTYAARKELEHTCWTGFFVSVVVCQCGNLIISKTRRVSIVDKIFDNKIIFFAVGFMLSLACFLSYTPGMSTGLGMVPVRIEIWLCAIPFSLLIIVYDEFRRFIIRKTNWTWFEKEFFY